MTPRLHPRRPAGPLRLDKWYLDALMPDGTVVLVYLGTLRFGPLRLVRVSADLFLPDGTRHWGGAGGSRPVLGDGSADFGAGGFDGERLWWETPGLFGELTFTARYPGFELCRPLFAEGRCSLHWVVEVPDAEVTGEVRWPGGATRIIGRGYRDHVWTDIPLRRLPLRELRWGRAVAGEQAAVWISATGPDGKVTAGAWQDGGEVEGPFAPPLGGPSRVLLEGPVIDLEGLRLGPLRAPLRRLLHPPYEVKQASAASFGGSPGRAIHEVVTWPA